MKVEIQLSMSSENENEIWNSVFQSRRKMKNKNRSLNFVFGNRRETENANGISNFVFKCRRKTVGTRVHAFFSCSKICLNPTEQFISKKSTIRFPTQIQTRFVFCLYVEAVGENSNLDMTPKSKLLILQNPNKDLCVNRI